MKFSILVPAYNEAQSITPCLNSLIAISGNKEIIVIDDASTDRTTQIVQGFFDKDIILVKREKNGGRAAALNSGLKRATGDIVVTTDADAVAPSDWLQRFEFYFRQKDVVAVGGAYEASNTDKRLAHATSILDQIMNGLLKKSIVPNKLSGVNSAIRRDILLDIGGFREDSWWSEDSELGWKLKRIGRVIYDPHNRVSTLYPDAWAGIWKRKFCWGYAMGLKFKEKIPWNIKLWARPAIFIILFASLLIFLLTMPYGFNKYIIPGAIFFLVFSMLTILYIPLGIIVMIRNNNGNFCKTLPLLAIIPFIREFAYVYGMCCGLFQGHSGIKRPTWKGVLNNRGVEGAEEHIRV